MIKLKSLIKKDWILATKNYFFYVTLFMAMLMVLVINFVLPEETSIDTKVFILFENDVSNDIVSEYEHKGSIIVKNRKELDDLLEDNIQSMGMIFIDDDTIEYRMQGHENKKHKELIVLNTQAIYKEYLSDVKITTTELKDYSEIEDVSFNKSFLPLFHVMEPALLGMFLIATMIFSEKEENTMTVYATTPSTINSFIMSKALVLILLGLISLLLTTVLVVGLSANYFLIIMLTIVCSFMGSAFGLLLASFFDNIKAAMMWIISFSLLLSLPFATYFSPSFAPVWMKMLPTYYMLFAYKEAAFPSGNPGIIYGTTLLCLILGCIAYMLSVLKYKKIFIEL